MGHISKCSSFHTASKDVSFSIIKRYKVESSFLDKTISLSVVPDDGGRGIFLKMVF